ncbi:54S ribosomal protein L4 mitochondrial [Tulasnella sp. 419]|nr:54S ribosomal protein L4 mitochondrial [Tulasnella sp. 419]
MSFLTIRQAVARTPLCRRSLATVSDQAVNATVREGALRPAHNVEIDPEHGLWAFFRKTKDGKYTTLEPAHKVHDFSGRSWQAAELRRKSFKDIHTLWYITLRERNLLATQAAEMRRLNIRLDAANVQKKDYRCRKTMARIKLVLNERRLAYDAAVQLHAEQQATEQVTEATKSIPEGEAPAS